jgi:hypothetical protein
VYGEYDVVGIKIQCSFQFQRSADLLLLAHSDGVLRLALVSNESSLWFEFEENVSPAFWLALLSDWG